MNIYYISDNTKKFSLINFEHATLQEWFKSNGRVENFLRLEKPVNRESFQNRASLYGAFRFPKRCAVFDQPRFSRSEQIPPPSLCSFFRTKSGANTGRPSRTDRMNPTYETRLVRFLKGDPRGAA